MATRELILADQGADRAKSVFLGWIVMRNEIPRFKSVLDDCQGAFLRQKVCRIL